MIKLNDLQNTAKEFSKLAWAWLLPASPKGNIAMFHAARSGSTVLTDLLNQHSDVFWDSELYLPDGPHLNTRLYRYLIREPIKLLRLRKKLAYKGFYGFETQFYHLHKLDISLQTYVQHLERLGFNYFIILKRKNTLRITVSALIGLQKDKWHQAHNLKPVLTPIKLNVEHVFGPNAFSIIELLTHFDERFYTLNTLLQDQRVLHLCYEDDIASNLLIGYHRVCHFLNINPIDISVRYSKTNPFELKEMIINFEEVKQVLQGTKFEWMLYA